MRPWLIRGLTMAVLHAVAATAVAKVEAFQPTGTTVLQAVAIAVLVSMATVWSAIDAWLRGADVGRNWFIAALVAGPVSGLLSVIGRAVAVDQTGVGELWPALTGGAAFTALLVLIPAGLGMFVGERLDPPRRKGNAATTGDDVQRPSEKPVG